MFYLLRKIYLTGVDIYILCVLYEKMNNVIKENDKILK